MVLQWTGKERFVLLNGPVPECLRLVHGKELPVPKGWNSLLPTWEPQVTIARNCRFPEFCLMELLVPNLGTMGYHCKKLPKVTMARNCRFPKVMEPGNHRLPLQATAGSQRLELMLPNLGTIGYHCKELPIPKGWN